MGEAAVDGPAAGVRLAWELVPARVRAAVEDHLGLEVVRAENQRGGFSPGVAARVLCTDGTRAFVKAVGAALNPDTPRLLRREVRVAAVLPLSLPVPRLRWTYDDGDWVGMVFDEVAGRPPAYPWRDDELDRVLAAAAVPVQAAGLDLPALPDLLREDFGGYRRLLASPSPFVTDWEAGHLAELASLADGAADALAGDLLEHADLRSDNVLLSGQQVWFVDWPAASRGCGWFDSLTLVMDAATQGRDPAAVLARTPLLSAQPAAAVDAVLAGLCGYFADAARRPDPPGLPTVRRFQADQHAGLEPWLRRRLSAG